MEIILPQSFRSVPWKNGGGVTHEIARREEDGRLLWRLSVAEVAADGPFSEFRGLTRILTVVDGAGLLLETPGIPLLARPGRPVRFAGGLPVTGRLESGPVRNLNLIFDADRVAASVTALASLSDRVESAAPGGKLAVYCVEETILAAEAPLPKGALAIGTGGAITLGTVARGLLIRLDPA